MKTRRNQLLARAGLILVIGLAYALFCGYTGLALPCPFYVATGLYCPGCGVSRLCLSLLRLDFAGAWRCNPALLLLAPCLGGVVLKLGVSYVRTGRTRPTKGESAVIWAVAALLLAFGVVRNLPGFEGLRPG